jgi:hypothetical protein
MSAEKEAGFGQLEAIEVGHDPTCPPGTKRGRQTNGSDYFSFGLFLLPGGRPRRFTSAIPFIQSGGRARRFPWLIHHANERPTQRSFLFDDGVAY